MRRLLVALSALVVALIAAACSGGGGGGDPGSFLLAIGDSDLATDGSGTASTTLLVARQGYKGPITVTLGANAPAGLTMEPLTIAAGATSGTLVFHRGTAALGGPFGFSVIGTGTGEITDDVLLSLLVTGPSGTLDTTFGTDGTVTVDFPNGSVAESVIEMPDGSFVLAGYADGDFALARVSASGTPVTTFGSNGRATLDFSGGNDWAYSIVRQFDGKLVAAGSTTTGGDFAFALARFTANGQLDPTFGNGGRVVTKPGFEAGAWDMVMQPDGMLLAAGTAGVGSNFVFTLIRYADDGTLDSSFGGGDGIVTRPLGQQHAEAYAVTVRSDGLIIAGGYSMSGGERHWTVAFFDIDGSSIGPVTSGSIAGGEARGVAYLEEGFLTAGKNGSNAFIARLRADGNADPGFGFTAPGEGGARAMALQPDGRIVIAGGETGEFLVWRVEDTGTADSTFGTAGKTSFDLGGSDRALALIVAGDTRLVVAGEGNGQMGIARLWP